MSFCQQCGSPLRAGSAVCDLCGAEVPVKNETSICSGCGCPLDAEDKVCPICGQAAPAPQPQVYQAAPVVPGAENVRICSSCLCPLDPEDTVCPVCGTAAPAPVQAAPQYTAPRVESVPVHSSAAADVDICPECSCPLDRDDAVCPMCGWTVPGRGRVQQSAPVRSTPVRPTPAPAASSSYAEKAEKKEGSGLLWGILGFLIPLVGLILYFVMKRNKPRAASAALKGAIISFVLNLVLSFLAGL